MKNMMRWHEYDNLIRDIPIYDGKNMDLADWLLQNEKVAVLKNHKEYDLATAKSTCTPYKMLKRMENDHSWQDIWWKLEEVYSPLAMEVHAANDLHRKQWPDETLQVYIKHFTDLTEKAMGCWPS